MGSTAVSPDTNITRLIISGRKHQSERWFEHSVCCLHPYSGRHKLKDAFRPPKPTHSLCNLVFKMLPGCLQYPKQGNFSAASCNFIPTCWVFSHTWDQLLPSLFMLRCGAAVQDVACAETHSSEMGQRRE